MATGAEELQAEVRERVEAGNFIQRLAERVGATAGATAVFGDAIERDGITVIPVARAAWGFGGGGGGEGDQQGAGGGGGSWVSPLGYIELRDGHAEFKPLRDPRVTLLIAGAGLVALAIRSLRR